MPREYSRERGFFTIARNSGGVDYVRMAYGLALSAIRTQSKVPYLAVAVPDPDAVPFEYRSAFDQIVRIPWGYGVRDESPWMIGDKWKLFHMTPYERTIFLDADSLLLADLEPFWRSAEGRGVQMGCRPITYRGHPVLSSARQTFVDSGLPDVYTALSYMESSQRALDVTTTAEIVFKNWRDFYLKFLAPASRPGFLSGDVAYALTLKLLGLERDALWEFGPKLVHMRTELQGWPASGDWAALVSHSVSPGPRVKVLAHRQMDTFHYCSKTFLTDGVLEALR